MFKLFIIWLAVINTMLLPVKFSKIDHSDVELIFYLKKYFKSDLMLTVENDNCNLLAKKFYKFQNSAKFSLMGSIKIDEDFNISTHYISYFNNPIIVLDYDSQFLKVCLYFIRFEKKFLFNKYNISFRSRISPKIGFLH